MTVVTKTVEAGVSVVDSENPHGEFDVILSTDALDRDGERLYLHEWKQPLPEHITIDSDHDMSVVSTVGSGKPFINEAGQLQVRGTFASTPHAQSVRTLVNEGHIKTVSVAFRVEKNTKEGNVKRELLNAGFVAVPANPEAVVLSSKTAKPKEGPSREEMIRAAATQLGAMASELVKLMSYEDEEKSAPVKEDEKTDEDDDHDLPAEVEGDDEEDDDDDKTSSRKAGPPRESAAAAAEKSAAAAAETEATLQRARALSFLMKKTAEL